MEERLDELYRLASTRCDASFGKQRYKTKTYITPQLSAHCCARAIEAVGLESRSRPGYPKPWSVFLHSGRLTNQHPSRPQLLQADCEEEGGRRQGQT